MKIIVICFLLILFYGCATPVAELRPIMPPQGLFAQQDCQQLEKICRDKEIEIRLFASKQDAKASMDSMKMALNVLILPVFWGVGNNDNTAQFQAAMGYYQCAVDQAERMNCSFKPKRLPEILKEYGTPEAEQ